MASELDKLKAKLDAFKAQGERMKELGKEIQANKVKKQTEKQALNR